MIENAKLFEKLLADGKLSSVNPEDPIPLYDVEEIRIAWMTYKAECRGL